MTSKTGTKRAILISTVAILICFSMLLGVTFAWFTDSATSNNNVISAGKLKIDFEYYNGTSWETVEEATDIFDPNALWEPGHTEVAYFRLTNRGSLALKYQLGINIAAESSGTNMAGESFMLSNYIYMGVVEGVNGETEAYADRADAVDEVDGCGIISTGYSKEGQMLNNADVHYFAVVVYMPETVNNVANAQAPGSAPEITLGISLVAGQLPYESDSFGTEYDKDSEYGTPDGAVTYVSDEAGLVAAMSQSGTVVLTDDITLTQPLFVSSVPGSLLSLSTTAATSPVVERVFVAMDLRGHSIIMETQESAIIVAKSAILSVKDSLVGGGIYNRAEGGSAIHNHGALEIKNGTISGVLHAIRNEGGKVTVSGGTVIGSAGKAPSVENPPQPIYNESGDVTITGGAFNSRPDAVEDGYEIIENGDGTFSVVDIDGKPDDSVTEAPGTDTDVPGTDTEAPGTDTEAPGTDTEGPGTDPDVPGGDDIQISDKIIEVANEEQLVAAVKEGGNIVLTKSIYLTSDLTVTAPSRIKVGTYSIQKSGGLSAAVTISSTTECIIECDNSDNIFPIRNCNVENCTIENGAYDSDGATFTNCVINGGRFNGMSMSVSGSTVNGGTFNDISISGSTVNDGSLDMCKLSKCIINGGTVRNCSLEVKCTISGGSFHDMSFEGYNVDAGEFWSCDFTKCTVNGGASFEVCDFSECTINDGKISSGNIKDCNIYGGTIGTSVQGGSIYGGFFRGGNTISEVVINGGSFSGGSSFNACTFYNGTFDGSYSSCKFYGGTYSTDVSASLTMSYSCTKIADGVYVVSKNVNLPEGSVTVSDEDELIEAVANGGYILLGGDIVLTKDLDVSADCIINLNNYTLSAASDVGIKAADYCVIKGGTVQKLDIYYCTIDGGTFDACVLYSCTISAGTYGKYSCYDCTVLGGTFGKNGTVVGGVINAGSFEGSDLSCVSVKEGQFEDCSFTDCELRGGYYTGGTFGSTDSERGQITGVYGGTYSGGKFTDVSIGNYPMLVDCEIIASGIGDATYTNCTITDCTSDGGSYENCTITGCTFYFGSFTGKAPTEDQIAEGHKLVDKGNGKYTVEIA